VRVVSFGEPQAGAPVVAPASGVQFWSPSRIRLSVRLPENPAPESSLPEGPTIDGRCPPKPSTGPTAGPGNAKGKNGDYDPSRVDLERVWNECGRQAFNEYFAKTYGGCECETSAGYTWTVTSAYFSEIRITCTNSSWGAVGFTSIKLTVNEYLCEHHKLWALRYLTCWGPGCPVPGNSVVKVLLADDLRNCEYVGTYSVSNLYSGVSAQDGSGNYYLSPWAVKDIEKWVMNTLSGRGSVEWDWHPSQGADICGAPLDWTSLAGAFVGLRVAPPKIRPEPPVVKVAPAPGQGR
jgi:hypothetical protein